MEISQYIRDLLFTHDRVVLSGFGAFQAKYISSKIDEKTNTMTPPSKDIVFDPATMQDGGFLRNYMVEQEKISPEEAEKQIQEYVKTIKSKLNAGKKVKFQELGVFSRIDKDKILFNYIPTENLLTDSYGLTEIDMTDKGGHKFHIENTADSGARHTENKSKKRYRGLLLFIIIIAVIVLSGTAIYFLKPEWIDTGRTYVTEMFDNNSEPADDDPANPDTNDENTGTGDTDLAGDTDNNEIDGDFTNEGGSDYVAPESTDTGVDSNTEEGNNTSEQENNETSYGDVSLKNPVRGRSYLIVGSLPTPELAAKEKQRLERKGLNVDIVPAGSSKYRLSVGDFPNFREATRYYNEFHATHKKMQPWLWEY